MTWHKESSNKYSVNKKLLEDSVRAAVPFRLTEELDQLIQNAGSLEELDSLSEGISNPDEDVTAALNARREELEDEDADAFVDDFIGNQGGAR